MFKKGDATKRQRLRADIIAFCHLIAIGYENNPDDPYRIARGTLTEALDNASKLPSENDFNDAVRYLDAFGALDVDWITDGSGSWRSALLTTKGVDLAEGSLVHPGIKFPRRNNV